jgi:prepilin-type N-terminal cleavage/methylation domain-containing protein
MRPSRGFTLIELVVATGVASIALPGYAQSEEVGRQGK